MTGTITIQLDGCSLEATERFREMIHLMFEEGVFTVKNGKAVLNFDQDGDLNKIELNYTKWHRKHGSPLLQDFYKGVIIKSTPNSTKEGV